MNQYLMLLHMVKRNSNLIHIKSISLALSFMSCLCEPIIQISLVLFCFVEARYVIFSRVVEWFFDFVKNLWLRVFKILLIKEPLVLLLYMFRMKRTSGSWVLKNFKRLASSRETTNGFRKVL